MKYLILIIVFFSIIVTSSAQEIDTTKENFKNEIGIDATWFIKNILDFGSNGYSSYYSSDYLISYKRFLSDYKAIRFGLGGMYSTRQDTGGYNSHTDFTDITHYFNARIGFEFRNQFAERWLVYYGADFLIGYNYSVSHNMGTVNGTPDVVSNTLIFGGGPVIGFELTLNNRLSLSTEGSIYFLNSKQDKEYIYKDTPEHNRQALHKSSQIEIGLPLSIFVKYRF